MYPLTKLYGKVSVVISVLCPVDIFQGETLTMKLTPVFVSFPFPTSFLLRTSTSGVEFFHLLFPLPETRR